MIAADESPPATPQTSQGRRRALLWAACLLALVGIYAWDALAWASKSAVWLHTDGHIHYDRSVITYKTLFLGEGSFQTRVLFLCTYGPLFYLVIAPLMALFGANWMTAVGGTILFGALGLVGAYLVGKALGGRSGGLLSVGALMSLPLFRIHTFDTMLDFPGACLSLLWLGLMLASEGFTRRSYSLLAGVALGAILLTRWPLAPGVGPTALVAVTWALWRYQPSFKLLLKAASLSLLAVGPPLAVFVLSPDGGLSFGLGVFLTLLYGAGALGALRLIKGVPGHLLGALLIAGGMLVPWYLRARSLVWESIAHQGAGAMLNPDVYASQAYEGFFGKILVVLNTLWAFETGPLLTALGLVAIPITLWAKPGLPRVGIALCLTFAISMDAGIIILKPPVVERWLFPGAIALTPLMAASLPALLPRLGPLLMLPVIAFYWVGAYGWHIDDNPHATPSQPWRKDIHVYNEAFELPTDLSFRYNEDPLGTLMPLVEPFQWTIPEDFEALYGKEEISVAFYFDEHLTGTFDPMETLGNLERRMEAEGWPLHPINPRDRVGGSWELYDAWALVEGPKGGLMPRFAKMVGRDEPLVVAPLGEVQGNRILLIWRPSGPLPGRPDERFEGTRLLSPGYGRLEGIPHPLPTLDD